MSQKQDQINDDNKADITELYKHAEVANHEMGIMNEEIVVVKNDIAWLKSMVKNIDNKIWVVIVGIITILIQSLLR